MQESKKDYLHLRHDIILSKDQSPSTNDELERMNRVVKCFYYRIDHVCNDLYYT